MCTTRYFGCSWFFQVVLGLQLSGSRCTLLHREVCLVPQTCVRVQPGNKQRAVVCSPARPASPPPLPQVPPLLHRVEQPDQGRVLLG